MSITAGASIVSDASGRGVVVGATPSGGKKLIAITIAAGAGELFSALIV